MLVKSEMNKLADNKEYTKAFNYFHTEYTELLKNFLQKNEVEVKPDDCLIDFIVKTRVFMPKYKKYTYPISYAMYNEELPEDTKYEILMSSYEKIYKVFNMEDV